MSFSIPLLETGLSAAAAFQWTTLLLGCSHLIQALEMIFVRSDWSDTHGVWRWGTLRKEYLHLPKPLLKTADTLLCEKGFLLTQWARTLAAAALLANGFIAFPAWLLMSSLWLVLVGSLLTSIRWRGAYNGGSDSMTLVVTLPVTLAVTLGSATALAIAYGYITLQLTLSYFVAGWVKLRERDWRTGRALPIFLATPQYSAPAWAITRLNQSPLLATLTSWAVMLFELSFPLAFSSPHLLLFFLAVAFLFHGLNAYLLGLNRFVFAWISAYPGALLIYQLLLS